MTGKLNWRRAQLSTQPSRSSTGTSFTAQAAQIMDAAFAGRSVER